MTDRHDTRRGSARTILVTGSTGNVGHQVVAQLFATGARVRAFARQPDKARFPDGVEVVQGDLTVPESVEAALDGVDGVFLVWPFMTVDAAPPALAALARHARHVVYLSASGLFHPAMERLIEASGVSWTFLRPSGFATNTLGWAEQIRREGVVRWPSGGATRSLIHEKDIAAVAVRALTTEGHRGAAYVLTGPEALTQIEQARIIGRAIGREVRYEELSRDEARQQLVAAWGDPAFVDAALDGWARMVSEPEEVTRTVEEVTGAPARSFAEWARDHADDFRAPGEPAVMKKLAGKVAVITGGTTGIGLATAELFAAEGARVIVTGVTPDRLEAARQALGERAEVVASDASSTADIEALVRHVRDTHGGVDVLFLNAGVAKYGLISALDEATLDETFRVNFKGPWLAIKHFAPHMRRGGSIVLNTSITHLLGKPYTSVYAASKAALRSLARTAAAELAGAGLRVNAVSPGVTDTPIHGKAGLEEAVRGAVAGIPLGRLGRPSDIAKAALFLASDDSAFMTGEEIVVDGGMTRV